MKKIYKNSYIKTLTDAEVNKMTSNQHELHGVSPLKGILGSGPIQGRKAIFKVLNPYFEEVAKISWYDSRKNHPSRSEYRFYYTENAVMKKAEAGDNIQIAINTSGELEIILHKQAVNIYPHWINQ